MLVILIGMKDTDKKGLPKKPYKLALLFSKKDLFVSEYSTNCDV